MTRRLLYFFFLIIPGIQAYSQQYSFIQYSVEQGLAQTQVTSMVQDETGFLWISTLGGASRFDGEGFENFSRREGLYKNYIRSLYVDSKGNIWFGSVGGVTVFNGETFKSYSLDSTRGNSQVTSMIEDHQGRLVLSTNDAGLAIMNDEKWVFLTTDDGLYDNNVRCLNKDSKGNIWVGTRKGINFLRGLELAKNDIPQLHGFSISALERDENGTMWIGTYGAGLIRHLRDGELEQFNTKDGLIMDWIRDITVDHNGHVWMATRMGASEFDGEGFFNYDNRNGLYHDNLKTVIEDREGNIWLGTDGKGMMKFCGKAFVNFTLNDGLPDDIILTAVEDDSGQVWFGTHKAGLTIFDGDTFRQIGIRNGLAHNTVWTSARSEGGRLWFGTSLGLSLVDGSGITNFFSNDTVPGTLLDNRVTSIYADREGEVWIGNREGLSRFISIEDGFENFSEKEGFPGKGIRSIVEDKNGHLWLGANDGLYEFDRSTFTKHILDPDADELKVQSLSIDDQERLWLGTEDGLYYRKEDQFVFVSLGEDPRANFINFLIHDDQSRMWIGTNYGIFELVTDDLREGDIPPIRSYSYHEGIRNLECNLNAAYKDEQGNYWFGTGGGLVRFNAKNIDPYTSNAPPKIVLTNIRLFFEDFDWEQFSEGRTESKRMPKGLELKHDKNHLTFDFIGLNFSNPEEVRYTFILEGFDESWSPLTKSTFATYSNLPPGEYVFKVKAVNDAGIWSPQESAISFEVLPPFWTTWWFYLLCGITFGLVVYLIIRWRMNVLHRKRATQQLAFQNKLLALEQQSLNASMNRHFIFNALNSIQYYINRQDKISANRYLTSFAKLIRKNLDSSTGSNLVSLEEELERIELYLKLEHMRFTNKFTYEINVDPNLDTESVLVPSMLLQPFLENSIWHGILPKEKPGKIKLDISAASDGNIEFIIEDDGIGIQTSLSRKASGEQEHSSKGMHITSSRIDLLKQMTRQNISLDGPFEINDDKGRTKGTRVILTLPMEEFNPLTN